LRRIEELLLQHRKEIEKFGVKRIALFGSFVRGEEREDSDIDLMVEFEEGRGGFKDYAGLIDYLEELLGAKVDLLTRQGLAGIRRKGVRERILKEARYVF